MEQINDGLISEQAREKYRNSGNVKDKWIREYKKISMEGDYQRNRACLLEIFNMLDFVLQNLLDEEMQYHRRLENRDWQGRVQYCFQIEGEDRVVRFYQPTTFKSRVFALNRFGYRIPEDIDDRMRRVRNVTTHGVETVIKEHFQLDYEYTKSLMQTMAKALDNLGMLDDSLIDPSFDYLRVKEGDNLQNGGYIVDSFIAEGGAGRVYKGRQVKLNRKVAIKELKPGMYDRELISKECRILVHLKHAQIPQIIDAFNENGTYYIVTEYVEGMTLQQYVTKYVIADRDIVQLGIQLGDLIGYLHQQGIIYSDIKPQNIMINQFGQLRLIDFGVARVTTQHTAVGYSTDYAAPEVLISGNGDQRADFYSMGVLLRELMRVSVEDQVIRPVLDRVIKKCLMRNPTDRYENARELKHALESAVGIVDSKDNDKEPKTYEPSKKRVLMLGTVAVVSIITLSILLVVMMRKTEQLGEKFEEAMRTYAESSGSSNNIFGEAGYGEVKAESSPETINEQNNDQKGEEIKSILHSHTENDTEDEIVDTIKNAESDSYAKREKGEIIGSEYRSVYYIYNGTEDDWINEKYVVSEKWIVKGGSESWVRYSIPIDRLPSGSGKTFSASIDLNQTGKDLDRFVSFGFLGLLEN